MIAVKRRAVAGVLVGSLAVLLAGCGKNDHPVSQGGTPPPPKQTVLKVATTDAVTSLDPAGPYEIGSRTLQANIFQTLLTITPDKPTPVPDAADCQYDAPTIYTCSLKKDLTFPNGHELTSSDVKFSFDRMLKLKTPGGPAALFTSVASVTTPDELTAVFNLKRPDARLPYLLTITAASILDEEFYPTSKLLNDTAMGSGPYELTSYKAGRQAVLTKFTGYRGARGALNGGVELNTVADSAALTQAVTSGKADVALHGFGPTDLDKLRSGDKVQVVEAESAETRFFSFNFKSATARRPAVRRAVAQLLDRATLVKKAYADHVTPLYSVIPPGFGGHVDAFKAEYKEPNKAAATMILRDGGLTGVVTLTLGWTPTHYGPGAKAEAIEVKRQLEASGLFKVNLRGVEWPQYQQLVKAGTFDLYHAGWTPEYPDSDDYLVPIVREGAVFQNAYRSQNANKLMDQEIAEQNQLDREELLENLQRVLAHDVPALPSWQGRLTVVAGKDIKNVAATLNPLSFVYFSSLRK
ncbi:ABC transporter substrate-binding protein [Kribbella qitaiheensis]|uniref:ABC transporter substrate-binding protein n=1 Tax=Kribbella qitaiheensis TaxID=1544730 RepID=A0A7G6WST8_9ACTN|nr:ABC transporter substrate-binding protein [Kribbella qitaiheensis]QNE17053.1 ABC transporter substrate-binding protein [Kribbella qitaiheensis]